MDKLYDQYDRLHDYIRLSITDRCNLRCVYCMPKEGLPFFFQPTVFCLKMKLF